MEFIRHLAVIAGIFTGELLIKDHIEETADEKTDRPALHGLIRIRNYHNYGAALNAGQKNPAMVTAASLALCIFATFLFLVTFAQKGPALLKRGLTLLLGGAYSNTYDRLKRHYVVDYVSFPVRSKCLRNMVFNLSDFCIVVGALFSVAGY